MSHNINGLKTKLGTVKHFALADIVLLQETLVSERDVEPLIPGFLSVHAHADTKNNQDSNRGKRGLLFAIKKSLNATTTT